MKPSEGMKNGSPTFESSREGSTREWLREKVYEPKKARTVDLVTQAIGALRETKQRISLASVSRKSKEIDPDGMGVSESVILTNETAHAYYKQHCTWQGNRPRRTPSAPKPGGGSPQAVNPTRDVVRVRQRYLRMAKTELVDRLIAVEHAYSEQQALWLQANDELLTTQLCATHQQKHQGTGEAAGSAHDPTSNRLLRRIEGMQKALDAKEAAIQRLRGQRDALYEKTAGPGLTKSDLHTALQGALIRAQEAERKLADLRASVFARRAMKMAAVSRKWPRNWRPKSSEDSKQ